MKASLSVDPSEASMTINVYFDGKVYGDIFEKFIHEKSKNKYTLRDLFDTMHLLDEKIEIVPIGEWLRNHRK